MSSQHTNRVLMVAFHYPPDHSSSGVLRTLKFSRYLLECGWEPTILTVRECCYASTDSALMRQIPEGIEICRTRAINTKKSLSFRGRYLKLTAIPDPYIGWLPFAVLAGMQVIRRRRMRAIYSTSPLASAHLIALTLKSLTGLPWFADFRDPWTEPELADNPRAPLFRMESWLERRVLRLADRLIFTTSQLRDEMTSRHRGVDAAKSVVIPNGYDEEDFQSVSSATPPHSPITILHSGLVDEAYRSPKGFLEALANLIHSGEIPANQIRVEFLGGGAYVGSAEFTALLKELELEGVVKVTGRLSYAECLEKQARSHILLLLQCGTDTRSLIPAKAFEYLRIGRPILAVVPASATSELLGRTGGAHRVDPEDRCGMRAALLDLFHTAQSGLWRSSVNQGVLKSYSRPELARSLARQLDDAISNVE